MNKTNNMKDILVRILKEIRNRARNFLMFKVRYRYIKHGRDIYIKWNTKIWSPHKHIVLGNRVEMGFYCIIGCDIEVGNNVLIGSKVKLIGSDDRIYNIIGELLWDSPRGDKKKIVIEDDVWIGAGSVIISGVKICRGAIVGAGSVVVKDVAPYSIVAGVPARCIKMRFSEEEVKKHESILKQKSQPDKKQKGDIL